MPLPPAELTSCIEPPRIAPGLCAPSAQSTASVMLLLPEPFGPTITLTPGENSRLTRSGKDLKPFIGIDRRYMGLKAPLYPRRESDFGRSHFAACQAAPAPREAGS